MKEQTRLNRKFQKDLIQTQKEREEKEQITQLEREEKKTQLEREEKKRIAQLEREEKERSDRIAKEERNRKANFEFLEKMMLQSMPQMIVLMLAQWNYNSPNAVQLGSITIASPFTTDTGNDSEINSRTKCNRNNSLLDTTN